MINRWNQQTILIAFGALLLVGAGGCLLAIVTLSAATPRENALIGMLLTVLSFAGSAVLSYVYGTRRNREAAQEKIDTIAQQSSEKILNLSTQLWRLEQYLKASLEKANREEDLSALETLRNRFDSASYMARMLRSANNTFLSDWQGVVTDSVNEAISKQSSSVKDIIEAYDELDSPDDDDEVAWESKADELLRKVELLRAELPSAVTPDRTFRSRPAVRTEQSPEPGTLTQRTGRMTIEILRSVHNATGSGRFDPPLRAPPTSLSAELIEQPDENYEIEVRTGGGTTFDFNIHLKTAARGHMLPVGKYVLQYSATIESEGGQQEVDDE